MKLARLGFIVVDDDQSGFCVPTHLRFGEGLPGLGVLSWGESHVTLFASRPEARAAIRRTKHYQLAMDEEHVDPSRCRVLEVRAAPRGKQSAPVTT